MRNNDPECDMRGRSMMRLWNQVFALFADGSLLADLLRALDYFWAAIKFIKT